MAGFFLESFAMKGVPSSPMKLLDLGGCEIADEFQIDNVRGAWTYWSGSSQWRTTKTPNRVLLIEGQPDRFPEPDESIEKWLSARSGSFRGFEVVKENELTPPKILIFVDPLGTRPVYFLLTREGFLVSDKLASVALNGAWLTELDWGGLLESAALGSLYSHKTTLKGALCLPPGTAIELRGNTEMRRWKNTLPSDPILNEKEVRQHPADTLRIALTKAVHETWTNTNTRLLLSGGLDSRILLALAAGKRKALTLEVYSHETEIAKSVAMASGTELELVPAPDYEFLLRWAYLATGAMHDSRFCNHLGLAKDWRQRGIPGITHGYFHNTMYRGWAAKKFERYPTMGTSILFQWMGRHAYYFDRYGCIGESLRTGLGDLLNSDGHSVLNAQLSELSDSLQTVIVDGYDLTFERRLLSFVSRQVFFAIMLSWYEGLDVVSPIFQPTMWTWYGLSRPRDRDRDWAIREVFLSLDHPAAKLPDSNTRKPVAHLKPDLRDRVRNQFWYPPLRTGLQRILPQRPVWADGPMSWGSRLRQPSILAAMEEALCNLNDCPMFDRQKVESALERYRMGDNHLVDTLCALTSVGQWVGLIKKPDALTQFVRISGNAIVGR